MVAHKFKAREDILTFPVFIYNSFKDILYKVCDFSFVLIANLVDLTGDSTTIRHV